MNGGLTDGSAVVLPLRVLRVFVVEVLFPDQNSLIERRP
jgi:hypothetical protein